MKRAVQFLVVFINAAFSVLISVCTTFALAYAIGVVIGNTLVDHGLGSLYVPLAAIYFLLCGYLTTVFQGKRTKIIKIISGFSASIIMGTTTILSELPLLPLLSEIYNDAVFFLATSILVMLGTYIGLRR